MTDNFAEVSQISLRKPVDTEHGQLPVGAVGTVVRFDAQAENYHVKFLEPFHADVEFAASELHEVATALEVSAQN